jgi:iron complex transport system substrate-binding protein
VPKAVARFPRADLERLIALRPDLVIVSEYTDADFLHALAGSRLRAHRMSGLTSLAGVRQAILDLGSAVGEPVAARRLAARFDDRVAELGRRLQGAPRPRALYWSDPFTAGGDTAVGALIESGGATNVGRQLGLRGLTPLGAERVFLADPDVLILGRPEDEATLRAHPLLSRLRAVREGRMVHVPPRLLMTLSQHAADACWAIAAALHPDRVKQGEGR